MNEGGEVTNLNSTSLLKSMATNLATEGDTGMEGTLLEREGRSNSLHQEHN